MFKKIIENSGSNVLVLIVRVLITLIMTPVILKSMGNHDYGIWEMVSAIIGYMGLLDLGMKPAITRFTAMYRGEGDRDKLFELFSTSLIFMGSIGVTLCVAFSVWAYYGADILSGAGGEAGHYDLFLLIIALQLLIIFPGYVAECFVFGFQKYALNNLVIIINIILGAVFIYLFINDTNALVLVAMIGTVGMIVRYFILFIIVSKRDEMAIRFNLSKANLIMFKQLVRFGTKSFVQGAGSVIENRSGMLLVGWLLGPSVIPYFAIPASLARYLQTIGWAITNTFMPLFSDLLACKENEKLKVIYLDYSRYIIGLLLPLGIGMCLFGVDFIKLWVGEEYINGYESLLYILVIYFLIPFVSPFNMQYLVAKNKHKVLAVIYPAVAIVNVLASLVMIKAYGVIGAALGALLPTCIAVPILLKYVCDELGIQAKDYIVTCIFPAILPAFAFIACAVSLKSYEINNYSDLVIQALVTGALYFVAYIFLVLKINERKLVMQSIVKLLER